MYTPVGLRAVSSYRQVGVNSAIEGASPHMLIKMLFDGLIQALNAARGAMARGDVEEKCRQILKSVRILEEGLKGGLDYEAGGELSQNLGALYTYCSKRLTQANLKNDVGLIEEVVELIEPVAESWRTIEE